MSGGLWPALRRGGAALALALLLAALVATLLPAVTFSAIDLENRLSPPLSGSGLLGTDQLGRSVAARLLAGLSWSVGIAAIATALAMAIGLAVGLAILAATGRVAGALRRVLELTMAFPTLVLAIALIAIVGQGFWSVVIVLGAVSWPVFARIIEAEGLAFRNSDFVLAARLYNLPEATILVRHVLPQVLPSLLVVSAFHFADMLIAESALSFLGIGAPLGMPTWGNALSESRQYLHNAPWLMIAPGAAIVVVVVAMNFAGDWLIARSGRRREDVRG